MNNRAMVLDVESTGIADDAQATELGWCDVYFNDQGELQPSSKAFVQRCKPELPISFGSMAVTHIHDDELVNEPSHKDVISQVVNDSVDYVIGHNIDYDMKVVGNAGVTRPFKRICTLAISRACYPINTDHKLLAMLYMLDYDFARQHGKNAHSAKFDVMFCVRILRILCIKNNIRNMEQLYQFSEHCRVPVYLNFGKHKGKHIDEVDLGYKRFLLDKGIEDPYVKIAFERSVAKNMAQIAERNRIEKEQRNQERDRIAAEKAQNNNINAAAPVNEEDHQPSMLQDLPDDNGEPQKPLLDDASQSSSPTQDSADNFDDSESEEGDAKTLDDIPADTVSNEVSNDDILDAKEIENAPAPTDIASSDIAKEPGDEDPQTVVGNDDSGVNPDAPKKKPRKRKAPDADACTAPDADDIPPVLSSKIEERPTSNTIEDANTDAAKFASTVPEQDDEFYKNPTKFDPMSKPVKVDPLLKPKTPTTDPYKAPISDLNKELF